MTLEHLSVTQKIPLYDPLIRRGHSRGVTGITDELVCPLDHAMALPGMVHPHLASCCQFKALFRTRLRLYLRHDPLLPSF